MIYPEETVQSQYAASPTINALIDGVNEDIDPREDIKLFYDTIFNPDTAKGVGLDYWGRIVAMERTLNVTDSRQNFGFDYEEQTGASKYEPFDQGVFFQNVETNTGSKRIEDSAYRKLIMWKAKANISGTSLHNIEECLNEFLSVQGDNESADNNYVVAQDDGVMNVKITFRYEPTPFQQAVINQYRNLFVGAGVSVSAEVMTDDNSTQNLNLSTFSNE